MLGEYNNAYIRLSRKSLTNRLTWIRQICLGCSIDFPISTVAFNFLLCVLPELSVGPLF